MSLLTDFMQKEQELKKLQEQLETLRNDDRLKNELEFKDKLDALMSEYGKSTRDVISLLDPKAAQTPAAAAAGENKSGGVRRKRKLKIYNNPNTGEVIETRGGNHKQLKEWKEAHGAETVESWLERTES
ncbi:MULTISPECIES: histone-like nucleoid-structuring protein, MvaT/MvaU family [Cobetia]|uniref:H-NS histone n=1 Tax=Cobetia crustatorum TaxID=553385 RepID=A0A558HNI1_9GAMM|nr:MULTISPECIES: histone-like nucleoid-structuring protein, MvaT/MvaU family [Cobetia]TVU70686.1 H-NS histone [Cobetia crustatorum]